jgi:hypothetical protein
MKLRTVIAAAFAAFALGLAAPAGAVAAPISTDYCTYSLRGGGSHAPDNDVKQIWDQMEVQYGWNITNSWAESWYRISADNLQVTWVFYGGGYVARYVFACWRTDAGVYHDDDMRLVHGPRP